MEYVGTTRLLNADQYDTHLAIIHQFLNESLAAGCIINGVLRYGRSDERRIFPTRVNRVFVRPPRL